MEAFTTKGHWWLPGNRPDDAIAGILTFDPRGRSQLELFDSFHVQIRNEPVILGVGEKGQAITLVDCLNLNVGRSISDYEWRRSIYRPRYALQGYLYETVEQILFEHLWINFYGLDKWAATGKKWEPGDLEDPLNERSSEDDIAISLDGFGLTIGRGHAWSGNPYTSLAVERHATIEIAPETPWGYKEVTSKIFQFQVFLSLALGAPTWPAAISATNPDNDKKRITLHYFPVTEYQETNDLSENLMVFTLNDLNPKLEPCLRNWFAKSEKLRQVFGQYNRVVSKEMNLHDKFMELAKAVEAYHRLRHEQPLIDEDEYKSIYKKIKRYVKSEYPTDKYRRLRARIYENLAWANSPSLKDRMLELQEKHLHISDHISEDYDSFVKDFKDTRDFVTHLDESLRPKAKLDGPSMYYMSQRLLFILEGCLLSELGFANDEFRSIIESRLRNFHLPPRPASTDAT